jgi:hypothetical protein
MDANNAIAKRVPLSVLRASQVAFKLQGKTMWFKDAGINDMTGIHLLRPRSTDPVKKPITYFEHGIELYTIFVSYELVIPKIFPDADVDSRILHTFKMIAVSDADPFDVIMKLANYCKITRDNTKFLPSLPNKDCDSDDENMDIDIGTKELLKERSTLELTGLAIKEELTPCPKKKLPPRAAKVILKSKE